MLKCSASLTKFNLLKLAIVQILQVSLLAVDPEKPLLHFADSRIHSASSSFEHSHTHTQPADRPDGTTRFGRIFSLKQQAAATAAAGDRVREVV